MSTRELETRVRAWIEDDPDAATRAELEALLKSDDAEALLERFEPALSFGTAGLRGLIGAGPARMNLASVARAAAGVASQVLSTQSDARQKGVVVGRDARRMSLEFARATAEVLVGFGLPVHWFDEVVPTPVAAFASLELGAAAAVVVTASHNPPDYNGFKVYSPRGTQIVPPQDVEIRAAMDAAGSTLALPRVPFSDALADGRIQEIGPAIEKAYLAALDTQCLGAMPPPSGVSAVTTALHGVGQRWVEAALLRRGHRDLHVVAEQAQPDGRFPTVSFPNPEEEGALDLSLALAREQQADLVLANDPDTDRLCVAVRSEGQAEGYRVLSGNEIGVLLADWTLRRRRETGRLPERPLVVTTVVSSSMLGRVAEAYGARCVETLTGFKWIWDRALALADQGFGFVFGFEEALGYCVGDVVRDKDGIGAAQAMMDLAASLGAKGESLLDRLDELACLHGLHLTSQVATVLPGLDGRARIDGLMAGLRAESLPTIAGSNVVRSRDLQGDEAEQAGVPRSNVLTWWLEDGSRVIFRPSGTEPKLKAYLEVRAKVSGRDSLQLAEEKATVRLADLEAWVRETVAAG